MLILIMLGLLASALPVVSNWFWGLYIISWICWVFKLIAEIILIIYHFRTENSFDLK